MSNQLQSLARLTTVVADTGDIDAIVRYQPEDATTNPSLLLKAAALPRYAALLEQAVAAACQQEQDEDARIADAADRLSVAIGCEILAHIPGRISTEVDARLSFDTAASLAKARKLIGLYEAAGIRRERVLIKLASTWEGIRAAEQLEREGISCNLTLLFSFAQARACAEAGVTLISPFVGRILDWYVAHGSKPASAEEDPGVVSVRSIYRYYKQHGYPTIVMGASFRNTDEILALAGCDRLTIGPALLETLSQTAGEVQPVLQDDGSRLPRPAAMTEQTFRWEMNEDAMATEKLAEGIRLFAVDQRKLEVMLRDALQRHA